MFLIKFSLVFPLFSPTLAIEYPFSSYLLANDEMHCLEMLLIIMVLPYTFMCSA